LHNRFGSRDVWVTVLLFFKFSWKDGAQDVVAEFAQRVFFFNATEFIAEKPTRKRD